MLRQNPVRVSRLAKELYPRDALSRALLYSRACTLKNLNNPAINPASIVLNIQGHAGVGKTAMIRQLARNLNIGYEVVDVGGVTDVAEIFGISRVNPVTGRTEASPPAWWPNEEQPEGIINIDDLTRALPHVIQALQQFINTRKFHNLVLPEGWTIAVTTNPDDGSYNVSAVDEAYETRLITLIYNRPEDVFLEQLEKQSVDDMVANFWQIHQEQLRMPRLEQKYPKPNDRTRMMFNHLYPYLANDTEALISIGSALFGYEWTQVFLAFQKNDDQPLNPDEILEVYKADSSLERTVKRYFDEGRNDLLKVSAERLVTRVRQVTTMANDKWKNLVAFVQDLPKDVGFHTYMLLVQTGQPSADLFRAKLMEFPELARNFAELAGTVPKVNKE